MLITTTEEFRLAFPSHAIDDITPFTGFIENSELDFLRDKLGDGLYSALCAYYKDLDITAYIAAMQDRDNENASFPYPRLLFFCQRAIANDAMARAIDVMGISLSNFGVNVATADDYGTPSKDRFSEFKASCNREAHICINLILELLESFCSVSKSADGSVSSSVAASDSDDSTAEAERSAIAALWKGSRYYFIASGLLIPTARILNEYVNFYENRERFIMLLPDLHYIQDELIAPLIGEDFCDSLVTVSREGTTDKTIARLISRLRKCEAAYLEERTSVLNISKERKLHAHDEGERHIHAAVEYCAINQSAIEAAKLDGVTSAPWYVVPDKSEPRKPLFTNNERGNAMFVLPAMN